MAKLILIRHGQSIWNAENRFTGWTNVELSEKGELEALEAGKLLSKINIDSVHTSDLIRAQKTAEIIMKNNEVSKDFVTHEDFRLMRTFESKTTGSAFLVSTDADVTFAFGRTFSGIWWPLKFGRLFPSELDFDIFEF